MVSGNQHSKDTISISIFLLGRWSCLPIPEYSFLPPVLNNTCCRRKSTASEKIVASVVSDTNGKEPGDALDKLFSPEQQASVLHVLNTASNKELEAFRLLRGRKSVSIVEHRKKFGPFQSLESLVDVPFIQYKTAVQVCNSILCSENGRKEEKSQEKWLLRKFIRPAVERERLKVHPPRHPTLRTRSESAPPSSVWVLFLMRSEATFQGSVLSLCRMGPCQAWV